MSKNFLSEQLDVFLTIVTHAVVFITKIININDDSLCAYLHCVGREIIVNITNTNGDAFVDVTIFFIN